MKCMVVYYAAKKTSLCEKTLRRRLPELGLTLASAVFAARREALGEELPRAFAAADVVLTVGGLDFTDARGIRDVVSQAAANSRPSLCRRLSNSGGDGYLVRAGSQLLVMLPDDPDRIEAILRGTAGGYIRAMRQQEATGAAAPDA